MIEPNAISTLIKWMDLPLIDNYTSWELHTAPTGHKDSNGDNVVRNYSIHIVYSVTNQGIEIDGSGWLC